MNWKPYDTIIWDWNGTLLDDAWLCVDIMNTLLEPRGIPLLTPERYARVFDFPVVEYYRQLGFDFDKEPFETIGTEFIVRYEQRRTECRLQPGARAVLEFFRDQKKKQLMLSAYKQNTLEELIGHYKVRSFFTHVSGNDNHYAYGKVDQGLLLMKAQKVQASRAIMIGDTRHDAEVAHAMGVDCILIPSGHHSKARLEGHGAKVVPSLSCLISG